MTVAALGAAGAAEGAGAAGAAEGGAAAGGSRLSDMASGAGVGDMFGKHSGKSSSGKASGARRVLVAEFLLCMVVLAFAPLTGKPPSASAFMKRGSAIMGLFFVLGLIASAGRSASRAAAGFGGLITLVLLISDRSIFVTLSKKYGAGVGEQDTDLGGLDAPPEDAGEGVGDALGGGTVGAGEGAGDALGGIVGAGEGIGDVLGGLIPLPPLGPLGNGIR